MLKLYHAEEDTCLSLVVDASGSMDWGQPDKSWTARRLAGALAYTSLASFDRVAVSAFANGELTCLQPLRGRGNALRIWRFLADLKPGGETNFNAIARGPRRPAGITVLISDFMTETNIEPALIRLRSSRQEVVMLQILAPGELSPEVSGDVALEDLETGRRVELTATPAAIAAYRAALETHRAMLGALARSHGARIFTFSSAEPIDRMLGTELRGAGLLR